ncbi:MAG: 3-phosphoshikimate 1-carboxyvinyltransferase [Bacteroidetes bacterium MedPE-SWsnd-G1]|mgnify:CR=1 FL=1|nr:MAG: 3-phosphoshikimate 1-carboxyvinyltransferase [Bacteroidetes bacterium MedPE-SWsnd-G1]
MNLKLEHYSKPLNGNIQITGSKSESNRLLILKQFFSNLTIENLGNSDDANYMQKALASEEEVIDISHAGTAMRFLTAYFAVADGRETVLTGSKRMKERPIKILVDALRSLGANISYELNEGYPPIRIQGNKLSGGKVVIDGGVSSQYVSALLLIAPSLENGLELEFEGKITSVPYIKMTLGLLASIGVKVEWTDSTIFVQPQKEIEDTTAIVESDWSSASYYYSLVALSEEATITISSYKEHSLQGDSSLIQFYKELGVTSTFNETSLTLKKELPCKNHIEFDLVSAPDIAQTIAVTCFGLGISCDLTGLHTLKIKETDRLEALKSELTKLGADISVTNKSLHLKASTDINKDVLIKTFDDHRMAMAFAPLLLKTSLEIEDANVVSKSYPDFWKDIESLTK